jgi:hypothetical protein
MVEERLTAWGRRNDTPRHDERIPADELGPYDIENLESLISTLPESGYGLLRCEMLRRLGRHDEALGLLTGDLGAPTQVVAQFRCLGPAGDTRGRFLQF